MSDNTGIEWTDATLFGEPLPRRCSACEIIKPWREFNADLSRPDGRSYVCRLCTRVSPLDIPNRVERRAMRLQGRAWCSQCAAWTPVAEMTKQGVCREHRREIDRARYATAPAYRERRRAHATRRKRGVDPVPVIGREYLSETYDGCCAYCQKPAQTWDHVYPVASGGRTTPDNIVPCCAACNSSKRHRDVWEWIESTGRIPHEQFVNDAATHFW